MAIYNYIIDNFVASGSTTDKNIRIYDRNNILRYSINPELSYYFYKNNLVIIKSDNKEDIMLDFETNDIAISALEKLNAVKKQLISQAGDNVDYYTKTELEQGQLDSRYYTIDQTNSIISTSGHSHSLTGLTDIIVTSIINGEVLVYNNGVWVNSSFTFDTSAFTSNYYSITELQNSGSGSVINYNNLTNLPATLSGHGITDVFTKAETYNRTELEQSFYTTAQTYGIVWMDTHFALQSDVYTKFELLPTGSTSGILDTRYITLSGFTGITGHLIPSGSWNLGSLENPWSELYLSGHTLFLNGVPVSMSADGQLSVSGTTIPDINVLINGYSTTSHTHYLSELINTAHTHSFTELGNTAHTHSYTELSNTAHTHADFYTKTEIDDGNLVAYYTSAVTVSLLDNKSNNDHIHDDRYYTKGELTGNTSALDVRYYSQLYVDTHFYEKNILYTNTQTFNTGETLALLEFRSSTSHTHDFIDLANTGHSHLWNDLINSSHTHDETYYTQAQLDAGQLDNRYYTESEINSGYYTTAQTYTNTQTDALLVLKSNSSHTHDFTGLTNTAHTHAWSDLTNTVHTHDDRYYTETELNTGQLDNRYYTSATTNLILTGKSDLVHTHDDRYYTETELNAGQLDNRYYIKSEVYTTGQTYNIGQTDYLLTLKSNSSHTHDFTGLTNTAHTHLWVELVNSSHTHNEIYYTETELNAGQLDNRYYTSATTNTLLELRSSTSHTHNFVDLTNTAHTHLLAELVNSSHTHNEIYYTKDELNTGTLDGIYVSTVYMNTHFYDKGLLFTSAQTVTLFSPYYNSAQTDALFNPYYTSAITNTLLSYKSDSGHTHPMSTLGNTAHTHNDIYYTQTQLDAGQLDYRYMTTSGSSNITGDLTPAITDTYSLGSPTKLWKSLYIGGNTIFIDGYPVKVTTGLTYNGPRLKVTTVTGITNETYNVPIFEDLNSYSLTGHNHDDRYYTEAELNSGQLDSRYYDKTWIDTHYYEKTLLYTSAQTDAIFSNYYTSTIINDILSYFFNSAQTNDILSGYTLTSHTHSDIYYSKTELNIAPSINPVYTPTGAMDYRYYTRTWIDTHYYTMLDIEELLSGVTSGTSLTLSGYTLLATFNQHVGQVNPHGLSFTGLTNTAHTHMWDDIVNTAHTHDERYYTETELNAGQLNNLYYTKPEVYATGQTYNSSQTNILLELRSSTAHTHDFTGLTNTAHTHSYTDLSNTSHTHDDRYYTESEINSLFYTSARTNENFLSANTSFYTQTQVDNFLSFKSETGHTHTLSGLTDVNVPTPSDGEYLMYSAGTWINTAVTFDLSNYYNIPEVDALIAAVPTGATQLNQLYGDVQIGGIPTNGDALIYNSSLGFWVNSAVTVNMALYYTAAQTNAIFYNSAQTNAIFSQTGHSHYLTGLTDVSGVPTDGQILQYDSGSGLWIPVDTTMTDSFVERSGDTMTGLLSFSFMSGATLSGTSGSLLYVDSGGTVQKGSEIIPLYLSGTGLINEILDENNWSGMTLTGISISAYTLYDGQKYITNKFFYEYVDGTLYRTFYSQQDHIHDDRYWTQWELNPTGETIGMLDDRYLRSAASYRLDSLLDVSITSTTIQYSDNSFLWYNSATTFWENLQLDFTIFALSADTVLTGRTVRGISGLTGGGALNGDVFIQHSTGSPTAILNSSTSAINGLIFDQYGHISAYTYYDLAGAFLTNPIYFNTLANVNELSTITNGMTWMYNITSGHYENRVISINDITDFNANDIVYMSNNQTITGFKIFNNNVVINGDLLVSGKNTTIYTEDLGVKDKIITLNSGYTGPSGLLQERSGIEIVRGAWPKYNILFDEGWPNIGVSGGTLKMGYIGNLKTVTGREDTPVQNGIAYWSSGDTIFKTGTGLTWSGDTLYATNIFVTGYVSGTTTIGTAEDGTYTDGLFQDFTTTTPIGTPIDRFNELFKALVPGEAPLLDNADGDKSDDVSTGNLSFGVGNVIAGYTNADVSGVAFNGTWTRSAGSGLSGKRLGITPSGGTNHISGMLNYDVTSNGTPYVNYSGTSFGKANEGTLMLIINGLTAQTIDLTITGASDTTNAGTTSGFNLKSCKNAVFPGSGTEFDLFKHRSGSTWFVKNDDLRLGYNNIDIYHSKGSLISFDIVVDGANTQSITQSSTTYSNINLNNFVMTGDRYLSGIRYYTGGTAAYSIRIYNAYRNTYNNTSSAIQFNVTNCTCTNMALTTPTSESDQILISGKQVIVVPSTGRLLYGDSVSISTLVLRTLTNLQTTSVSTGYTGFMFDSLDTSSTNTIEYFRNENKRLQAGLSYDLISQTSSTYDYTESLISNSGLQYYNDLLIYPTYNFSALNHTGVNHNYAVATTDYSLCTSERTYYRYFYFDPNIQTWSLFKINIAGSGVITAATATLTSSSNKIKTEIKLPGVVASTTGWLDIYDEFVTGQWNDYNGCKNMGYPTPAIFNSDINLTVGTKNTSTSNGLVILKVTAGQNWTGNISQITFTFGN